MCPEWDDMSVWDQAMLLAFDQVRQYEESQELRMQLEASLKQQMPI